MKQRNLEQIRCVSRVRSKLKNEKDITRAGVCTQCGRAIMRGKMSSIKNLALYATIDIPHMLGAAKLMHFSVGTTGLILILVVRRQNEGGGHAELRLHRPLQPLY